MQKIRIKINGYDAKVVDKAALQIMETAVRTGAKTFGPNSSSN
jgi:ribosomal protein S10